MRLFVALPLPESYQQGLKELAARLHGACPAALKTTRPGNWHLTLKFLGEVAPEGVDDIRRALAAIRFSPFILQGAGAGFFGPPARPRVLWTGLAQGAREAAALARAVDEALGPLGFEAEKRAFRAHLTVARVKSTQPRGCDGCLKEMAASSWEAVEMDGFALYESVLGGGGPAYTRVASFAAGD